MEFHTSFLSLVSCSQVCFNHRLTYNKHQQTKNCHTPFEKKTPTINPSQAALLVTSFSWPTLASRSSRQLLGSRGDSGGHGPKVPNEFWVPKSPGNPWAPGTVQSLQRLQSPPTGRHQKSLLDGLIILTLHHLPAGRWTENRNPTDQRKMLKNPKDL